MRTAGGIIPAVRSGGAVTLRADCWWHCIQPSRFLRSELVVPASFPGHGVGTELGSNAVSTGSFCCVALLGNIFQRPGDEITELMFPH